MPGLFDGTPLERPVTCDRCGRSLDQCKCPRNAAGEITLPGSQPVRVRREKRGGKVVTVIAGLDPVASDLPALLKQFRTALGSGGTVKDGAIELQGDHCEKIVERLQTMGYPAKAAGA
ncbi:MAG TPA: translation initiation factor [Phycisphaerae bacterium]|nr:translation initiation factor [Phycisphaerae bacterium]